MSIVVRYSVAIFSVHMLSLEKTSRSGPNLSSMDYSLQSIVNNLVWLKNLLKLEASVTSLIENGASDKSQMSDRIEKIESNVISIKTGLEAKIDNVAVSETLRVVTASFVFLRIKLDSFNLKSDILRCGNRNKTPLKNAEVFAFFI